MLPVVIIGLALANKRRMEEIIPPRLMDLFKEWELRILVCSSLAIQLILFALGRLRKKISHPWIRIVVWTAYLSADAVAVYALGITPGELRQRGVLNGGSVDPTAELKAFWAPFLLIHLGGQDTITANSLEDNELWPRHWLSLFSQTVATLYVFYLSWTGSHLSLLSIVILICGLIKYGERVVILWTASSEQFRDSTPERQQEISLIVEEQNLKDAEGHVVVPHQVIELNQVLDDGIGVDWKVEESQVPPEDLYKRRQGEILIARRLIDIFRPAFTDMLLSKDDGESGKSTLKDMHYHSVFNIMSIELGFIYDLLFTKAIVFQTWWGLASRIVILSLTGIAFVVFAFFHNKASYHKIDRRITFTLLGVAFALELFSLLVHLLSDKVTCWLIHNKFLFILNFNNLLQRFFKRQRWSNKIGQFSLLSYSLKEKHLCHCCQRILGFLCIDDKVEKLFYKHSRNVSDEMKCDVVYYVNKVSTMSKDLKSFWAENWDKDGQRKKQLESLMWSMDLDFDMCILVWHMATHICLGGEENFPKGTDGTHERVSFELSRYMLYLLVMYPFMLPAGIGRIKFHDMYATVATFLDEMATDNTERNPKQIRCPKKPRLKKDEACNLLLSRVKTQLNLTVSAADKGKFVLFYGCKLASQLAKMEKKSSWLIIKETWIAMLILAATKCKASYHLQHLKRGGELLTHVWLLLVHYGFTDHFQIPHAPEIAELNVH